MRGRLCSCPNEFGWKVEAQTDFGTVSGSSASYYNELRNARNNTDTADPTDPTDSQPPNTCPGSDLQSKQPVKAYQIRCPDAPMRVTPAPEDVGGVSVPGFTGRACAVRMPDLSRYFALAGTGATISQTPAAGEVLYPAFDYVSNPAWNGSLPTSSTGMYSVNVTVHNPSGAGPVGTCSFSLQVDVPTPRPCAGTCPPPLVAQALVEPACSANLPDLASPEYVKLPAETCVRPHPPQGAYLDTASQLIFTDETRQHKDVNIFAGASSQPICKTRFAVYRASAPVIRPSALYAHPPPIAASSIERDGPHWTPVQLSWELVSGAVCPDIYRVCRVRVRTNDPDVLSSGELAFNTSRVAWQLPAAWEIYPGNAFTVHLSGLVRNEKLDLATPGEVLRRYTVALACRFNEGVGGGVAVHHASTSWTVAVAVAAPDAPAPAPP
eukprot:tig00020912_g15833.t1